MLFVVISTYFQLERYFDFGALINLIFVRNYNHEFHTVVYVDMSISMDFLCADVHVPIN